MARTITRLRFSVRKRWATLLAKWYGTKHGKRWAIRRYRKRHNSRDWPLEYMGPALYGTVDGTRWALEKGQPLRSIPGMRASRGAASYISPDGIERTIVKKHVRKRAD